MKSALLDCIVVLIAVCAIGAGPAQASALYSGTIIGNFTNPVLTGNLIALDKSLMPFDNTTTAVFTGFGTNTITWGTNTHTPPPPILSRFVFTGNSFTNQPADTTFALGTFRFLNGTSALNSLIFGATLHLSFSGNVPVTPDTSKLSIVTTINGNTDRFADADFVSFDKFPNTFNVFEGGESTATLLGKIVGDPQLQLTGITLAPNDPNGFLGTGQGSVPEPATLALMGLGLSGLAALRRRKTV